MLTMKSVNGKERKLLILALFMLIVVLSNFVLLHLHVKEEGPHSNALYPADDTNTYSQDNAWEILHPDVDQAPYDKFAPHINVVWSRGWYNAQLPPASVPISYYNEPGRESQAFNPISDLKAFWREEDLCPWDTQLQTVKHVYLWVRGADLPQFVSWLTTTNMTHQHCNITVISSDCIMSEPHANTVALVDSAHIHHWYAQNLVDDHPKASPIPLGLDLHTGFPGSPHTIDTLETMVRIRSNYSTWQNRKPGVLVDIGSLGEKGSRRFVARSELQEVITECGMEPMSRRGRVETWETYASHRFAVAAIGMGLDTHRLWELLFFGTVPIVMSSELDKLLIESHMPVIVVDEWTEVCELHKNITLYKQMEARYQDWIHNVHYWLRPNLWVPRDQAHMDDLCERFPGCNEARSLFHRVYPRDMKVVILRKLAARAKRKRQQNRKRQDAAARHNSSNQVINPMAARIRQKVDHKIEVTRK